MSIKTKLCLLHLLCPLALSAISQTAAAQQTAAPQATHRFEIGDHAFLLDGQPFQIRCGEMHAARVPREYWDHRLAMMRAMGLNTVCAYLFWNMHEPLPGKFNWKGQADAALFCSLAQKHGLWVILRPGPYSCAEWEMGGLPWWLLRDPKMQLRTTYPGFMEPARRYLREVGRQLAPLQITHGGPILMVQVENEYGSYGKDPAYMRAMRQAVLDAGFDVPLFACNGPKELRDGFIPELFQVVNFGSDPKAGFAALRKIQPKGPLMCGEFYPGWFDTWGVQHHYGDPEKYFPALKYMLEAGASFSIYMAHGGSTFGFWAGCDHGFKPDVSSYDYDAPINEAGAPTEKFFKTRELMRAHLNPGETIPAAPPPPNPVQTFAPVAMTQVAPLFKNLPAPAVTNAPAPLNFESLELSLPHGCALYRVTLPAGPAATLTAQSIADFGFVYLDGQRLGVLDRRHAPHSIDIPARATPATLDILVEAMGRINYSKEIHDRKGLGGPVRLVAKNGGATELAGWQIYALPLDDAQLAALCYENITPTANSAGATQPPPIQNPPAPAFWSATITLDTQADTWLDMRPWGKGVVWVNGRCLGRYWNIGPTQTMYVPGPWLRRGKNEIIILDLLDPARSALMNNGKCIMNNEQSDASGASVGDATQPEGSGHSTFSILHSTLGGASAPPQIAGLSKPILDQLRPALDFSRTQRRATAPALDNAKPVWTGAFPQGPAPVEIHFNKPARGRYFAIETLDAHDGKPHAAIAEIQLLDARGAQYSLDGWTLAYADSEEHAADDGSADNALDGQTATYWHTALNTPAGAPAHPHCLIIDLGKKRDISGFRYVPRQGENTVTGRIKTARAYVADNLVRKQ